MKKNISKSLILIFTLVLSLFAGFSPVVAAPNQNGLHNQGAKSTKERVSLNLKPFSLSRSMTSMGMLSKAEKILELQRLLVF